MMKKLVVAVCLALGASACGVEATEESNDLGTAHQEAHEPASWVCGMDDCPAGMCATMTKRDASCSGGFAFGCTTFVPGVSKCI